MSDNRDVIIAYRWLHNCTVTGNEGFAKKIQTETFIWKLCHGGANLHMDFIFPYFIFTPNKYSR